MHWVFSVCFVFCGLGCLSSLGCFSCAEWQQQEELHPKNSIPTTTSKLSTWVHHTLFFFLQILSDTYSVQNVQTLILLGCWLVKLLCGMAHRSYLDAEAKIPVCKMSTYSLQNQLQARCSYDALWSMCTHFFPSLTLSLLTTEWVFLSWLSFTSSIRFFK